MTTALYDAGFSSPSRLYEKAAEQLGMTPGEYRRGGAGATITFRHRCLRRWDACWLPRPNAVCARCASARTRPNWSAVCARNFTPPRCIATMLRIEPYVEPLLAAIRGENTIVDLPLDVRATAFQMKVWEELREIPRGETRSYSDSCPRDRRSQRSSRRGPRLRLEPCGLTVPCHRVVRSDGDLAGYRWGDRAQEEAAAAEKH